MTTHVPALDVPSSPARQRRRARINDHARLSGGAAPACQPGAYPTRRRTLLNTTPPDSDSPQALRAGLVKQLRDQGAIRTDRVADAIGLVPREVFAPEAQLADAYDPQRAVVTKRDKDGLAISSVSAANVQAFMLEQASPQPGENVLEIGSGGMNAAYLAELVGPDGTVTSIDIDPEVTDRARRLLAEAGYERVDVATTDGELGVPDRAPFDLIEVTVGAPDIPRPGWSSSRPAVGSSSRCACAASCAPSPSSGRATIWSAAATSCAASCRCRAQGSGASGWCCCTRSRRRRSGCAWTTATRWTSRP